MKTFIKIKKAGDDEVWARRVARAIRNVKDALEPYAEKQGYYKRDELCSMLGDLILIEKIISSTYETCYLGNDDLKLILE